MEVRASPVGVKDMIHGSYGLFTKSWTVLMLTQLGHKIAIIHKTVSGIS